MTRSTGRLRVEEIGPASPEDVWQRYTTPRLWPGWAPQIRAVDHPSGRIAPGSRGVVIGPLALRVGFVVDEVDDDALRWAWTPGVGPLRAQMLHGVDPTPAGSRAWVEICAPRPVALAYAPVARRALRRLVAR